MTDLEAIKQRADSLGIKYRSDIKIETLKAKIDAHQNPAEDEVVEVVVESTTAGQLFRYKNVSKINVFTEGGRCMPNGRVELTEEEALKYTGLEKCTS